MYIQMLFAVRTVINGYRTASSGMGFGVGTKFNISQRFAVLEFAERA